MAYITPRTGRIFRDAIRTLQEDAHRELHTDTFTLYRVERPAGAWDAGTAGETWEVLASGTCSLKAQGPGGPSMGEGIVYPESPYRVRLMADAVDTLPREPGTSSPDPSHAWMVINGDRLFKVEMIKVGAERSLLATAYVREVFDRDLPGVTP